MDGGYEDAFPSDEIGRGIGRASGRQRGNVTSPTFGRRSGGRGISSVNGVDGQELVRVPFKTASQFVSEYEPLQYALEPIIRTGSLYTLTAKTGAGKTAWMVVAALAVVTGRGDILGLEASIGRVAYCCFENPDDIRMRLMIAAFLLNVDLTEVSSRLMILDMRVKPEAVEAELQDLSRSAPFSLVFVDTLAAFFDGDDINNAVQGGEFIRRMRPITRLPGKPAVLVAAHPIKSATEDQLLPYGSGAILNEVDGNLTLWRKPEGGAIRFHWLGKLRGLEFEAPEYRFEISSSPAILDAKGRQIMLPTMRPAAKVDAEASEQADINISIKLLQAILAHPGASQRELGEIVGRAKSTVNGKLFALQRDKLVISELGVLTVTPKGEKALERAVRPGTKGAQQ